MDKAVLVGVFDFVNFHICKSLLDSGIEVKGIHFEEEVNRNFQEEKRLEIGRNANFSEQSLTDIDHYSDENETIIFSVYDLYMLYKENFLGDQLLSNYFSGLITAKKDTSDKIVLLAPSQLLTKLIERDDLIKINQFITKIKGLFEDVQLIYLPTIYGPWQSETFLFQQSILNGIGKNVEFKGMREETNDALYVDDAVKAIHTIIENNEIGSFLLESGEENQWEKCAEYLQVNDGQNVGKEKAERIANIKKVPVGKTDTISECLTRQIQQVERLYK